MPDTVDVDLDLGRIAEAAKVIDPVFLNTPQFVDGRLCAALGRRVLVKVETLNPIRSFKGRGAEWAVEQLRDAGTIVCASTGNFGQAVAYAARRRKRGAVVFMPAGGNPDKAARTRELGATVYEVDGDIAEHAEGHARDRAGHVYLKDGSLPAVAEGAGTIGMELLAGSTPDTVLAPVGDGALITGIARWVRAHAPGTRIVGVCASGAPSMAESWRAGEVRAAPADTIAEGVGIHRAVPESVTRMRALVDDIVLVDDEAMCDAIGTALDTLGLLLEPAGAAGLAALATRDVPGETVATVLSGANLNPALRERALAPRGERRRSPVPGDS